MSIIAYPLEAIEYTAEDAQSYFSTRKSGVYSEDITFTPEGMTVTLSPFLAWFNYAKFKGCSVAVTEPQTLTFSPSHTILDRIDRVVLRLDLSLNRAYFEILEGTPSSTPIAKTISKTEVINDISPFYVRIKAGSTQITSADITSTILDESLCGIMRDGVTGIPTSQLQKQVEELLLRLHEAIDGVEVGSAFMISDLYDPEKRGKPVLFAEDLVAENISRDFLAPTEGAEKDFNWVVDVQKSGKVVQGQISSPNINLKSYETLFRINNKYRPISQPVFTVVKMNSTGYVDGLETSMVPIVTGNTSETLVVSSSDYNKTTGTVIQFMYICK